MASKVNALQSWCKHQCQGYRDVEITNMTTSWKSGLAFCAIIHRYHPELIDYNSLKKDNVYENNKLAFDVAAGLGISPYLDPEDMVAMRVPDRLSILTYVSQYYNVFSKQTSKSPHLAQSTKRPAKEPLETEKEKLKKKSVYEEGKENKVVNRTFLSSDEMCQICKAKVYLMERHFDSNHLYHRSCFRSQQRSSSITTSNITKDTDSEVMEFKTTLNVPSKEDNKSSEVSEAKANINISSKGDIKVSEIRDTKTTLGISAKEDIVSFDNTSKSKSGKVVNVNSGQHMPVVPDNHEGSDRRIGFDLKNNNAFILKDGVSKINREEPMEIENKNENVSVSGTKKMEIVNESNQNRTYSFSTTVMTTTSSSIIKENDKQTIDVSKKLEDNKLSLKKSTIEIPLKVSEKVVQDLPKPQEVVVKKQNQRQNSMDAAVNYENKAPVVEDISKKMINPKPLSDNKSYHGPIKDQNSIYKASSNIENLNENSSNTKSRSNVQHSASCNDESKSRPAKNPPRVSYSDTFFETSSHPSIELREVVSKNCETEHRKSETVKMPVHESNIKGYKNIGRLNSNEKYFIRTPSSSDSESTLASSANSQITVLSLKSQKSEAEDLNKNKLSNGENIHSNLDVPTEEVNKNAKESELPKESYVKKTGSELGPNKGSKCFSGGDFYGPPGSNIKNEQLASKREYSSGINGKIGENSVHSESSHGLPISKSHLSTVIQPLKPTHLPEKYIPKSFSPDIPTLSAKPNQIHSSLSMKQSQSVSVTPDAPLVSPRQSLIKKDISGSESSQSNFTELSKVPAAEKPKRAAPICPISSSFSSIMSSSESTPKPKPRNKKTFNDDSNEQALPDVSILRKKESTSTDDEIKHLSKSPPPPRPPIPNTHQLTDAQKGQSQVHSSTRDSCSPVAPKKIPPSKPPRIIMPQQPSLLLTPKDLSITSDLKESTPVQNDKTKDIPTPLHRKPPLEKQPSVNRTQPPPRPSEPPTRKKIALLSKISFDNFEFDTPETRSFNPMNKETEKSKIMNELKFIDEKLKKLESEGIILEKIIRNDNEKTESLTDDHMAKWFKMIDERNELVRDEAEFMYRYKQLELEEDQASIELQLRALLAVPDSLKTSAEKNKEESLIGKLIDIVGKRSHIVDNQEDDRIRYLKEDEALKKTREMSLGEKAKGKKSHR